MPKRDADDLKAENIALQSKIAGLENKISSLKSREPVKTKAPLSGPDPKATFASVAACAANAQGKFSKLDVVLWQQAYVQNKFDENFIIGLA